MTPLEWLGLIGAALTGALVAIFRRHYLPSVDVDPDPTVPENNVVIGPLAPVTATTSPHVSPSAPPTAPSPPNPMPSTPKPLTDTLLPWTTRANCYHNTRVMCDRAGLPLQKTVLAGGKYWMPKDIICATLMEESGFVLKAIGRNAKSADYSLIQINDGPPNVPPAQKWYIGPGKLFSSPQDVFDHPERQITFIINYWKKHKHLNIWYAYRDGKYVKHLGRKPV